MANESSRALARELRHVAIAVPDLEQACIQYARLFGVAAGPVRSNPLQGVRLAYIDLGNAKIELITSSNPDSPVGRFLARNPVGGIHHFCLGVDGIPEAVLAVGAAGGTFAGPPSRSVDGADIAFVHPRSACGALIELEGDHH